MDELSIGTEICAFGVWGREVDGKFYNLTDGQKLFRPLTVNGGDRTYYTYYDNAKKCEYVTYSHSVLPSTTDNLKPYMPEHIRVLGNIKKGDLVWAQTISGEWIPVMFERYCSLTAGYVCVFQVKCIGYVVIDSEHFKAISQTCPLFKYQ